MGTPAADRHKRKIKSTLWHQARESGHAERAGKEGNPLYLRLTDLAIAYAGPNGHAEFGHGELTELLKIKDSRTLDKGIATAKGYGLLADGSHKRCLVVPGDMMLPRATGISNAEIEAARTRPCPTCQPGVPVRPARCHPQRERYTSAKNGSMCEPCYRRARKTGTEGLPMDATDDDPDWLSLQQCEPADY